eukprot:3289460-Rhodomonas_salina.1
MEACPSSYCGIAVGHSLKPITCEGGRKRARRGGRGGREGRKRENEGGREREGGRKGGRERERERREGV